MAYDLASTTDYIRQAARRRGIDPDIAVRVAKSEGLARGTWQSNLSKGGQREPSYGPFQMLVGGEGTNYPAGLGNDFKSRTGLDPSDPSNVNATIDFALDHASKNGWGAWYGAKHAGVGNRDGIGAAQPVGPGAAPSGLTRAVAERETTQGGTGSPVLAGGANGDQIASGGSGPTVNIGLKPERSTKTYDAMLASGNRMGQNADNVWELAGGLAQVWAATRGQRQAETENASELQKTLAGANLDPAYAMAAQLSGGREGAASAILAQQQDRTAAAKRADDIAYRQDERDYSRGRDKVSDSQADRAYQLQTARANQAPETPSSVREYEYAKSQGFGGTYQEWEQANRKAGATVINTGQDEGEFQKKAAGKMVDRFGTIAETGTAAANVTQTIPAMRELLTQAPTGPIAGRLAERFPGFSTAGDAFQATVNQIAPTLRVPGSGAMSDRDMDVLMSSFPRLRNSDGANTLIMGAFEKKAQINLQRSQIATAALRGDIKPADADRQLEELDRTPLLDDAMRQQLTGQPAQQQQVDEQGVPLGGQPQTAGQPNKTKRGVTWSVQ